MSSEFRQPLALSDVLVEEFTCLHGELPEEFPAKGTEEERLAALFDAVHRLPEPRSALCLSGGGIRSATFSLGVLQGLARAGLLPRFHYLSTVSGGGYIGSWLTSWIHRHSGGAPGVFGELAATPASSPEPEPLPLRRVRAYSNYLTPRLGILSADTWSLLGTILRNLSLNWLLLVPLLLMLLILPRALFAAIYLPMVGPGAAPPRLIQEIFLVLGTLAAAFSLVWVGYLRPSSFPSLESDLRKRIPRQGFYLALCIFPLFLGALLLIVYHGWDHVLSAGQGGSSQGFEESGETGAFVAYGIGLNMAAWCATTLKLRAFRGWELLVTVVTGAMGGACAQVTVHHLCPYPGAYICLALPAGILSFLAAATLFVGLMSRQTTDEDREWWAKFGGWLLMASLGWMALTGISIYGPDLAMRAKLAVASLGGMTGIATFLLGRSARTGAGAAGEKGGAGWRDLLPEWALSVAAPLFLVVLLVILAWGADGLISLANAKATEWALAGSPLRLVAVLILLLLAFLLFFAWLIDSNKFSLHCMYRNRLIRAYLGATHEDRRPNGFTGFDPLDNLPLHALDPEAFHVRDLADPGSLARRWREGGDPVASYLRGVASPRLERLLESHGSGSPSPALRDGMVDCLNTLTLDLAILGKALGEAKGGVRPERVPGGDHRAALRASRAFLRKALKEEIAPTSGSGPYHVINCALNLTHGDDLAWQQRKAQSFVLTPLHAGSCPGVGFRRACEYGGERGASLGTGVAVSGAAVSPNMGYHSSPLVTFLLTFFNARLGWWLGNPGPSGSRTYRRNCPRLALAPMVRELLGLTDKRSPYVYLSDGGHFENLGLYEMVRRRCRTIVVVDAGCDPEFAFEDLGNAVRKVRVDLGVSIEFKEIRLRSRSAKRPGLRCALGAIRYPGVDGQAAEDGKLVYIKPALIGDEPADVMNYSRTSATFPHESTADQWFSEGQFESYRALGRHTIEKLCGEEGSGNLPAFIERIELLLSAPPTTRRRERLGQSEGGLP